MGNFIKSLIFAFIAVLAQTKPLSFNTEEVKMWGLKLTRAILNSKQ
jgi:hypothetical protein